MPRLAGRAGRDVVEASVGDEDLRLAVVDDVGRLLRGEMPVDRREPQADALGRGQHDGELDPVGDHGGDGVALTEAPGQQGVGQLIGVGVELGECADAARVAGGHDGDRVGLAPGPVAERRTRRRRLHPRLEVGVARIAHHTTPLSVFFSALGSFGSPNTRSPAMLRCTWAVPPQMVPERLPRKSRCQRSSR